MGRKKKPFIDKKKAVKFHLVPRSQTDPMLGDSDQPQHVLKPEPSVQTPEDRLAQQQFYGVHFCDDYDYLQHLKEPGTALVEPAMPYSVAPDKMSSFSLPGGVFGSEVMMEGDMGKVLPVTGPQPDWDPDIVVSLDNPYMNFDLDDQLEDDFVLQANGGGPGIPVYVTDTGSHLGDLDEEGEMWWLERGDFSVPHQHADQSESTDHETHQSKQAETDQSDVSSNRAEEGEDGEVRSKVIPNWCSSEERVGTFTDYSISSSVVPRNKGLTQLDERFEKFMAEYDDAELGAPELEEAVRGEGGEGGEKWLLDLAVRDFEKNFAEISVATEGETSPATTTSGAVSGSGEWGEGGGGGGERGEEEAGAVGERQVPSDHQEHLSICSASGDDVESEEERGERERKEVVMVEVGKAEWDCESILSTYSNLYNHPTKIVEPSLRPKSVPIELSKKTGIPLGAIAGPLTKEKPLKQMPVTRPRLESVEEKRVRKKDVKEERKFRRSEKKATKLLFHSEQLRQEKLNFSQTHTAAVV